MGPFLFILIVYLPLTIATSDYDRIVDKIVAETQDDIRKLVKEEIPVVPDVSISWSKRLWPFKVNGLVRCIEGRITYVGRVTRVGDVTLRWDWGVVTLITTLKFKDIEMAYTSCELKLGILRMSDPLRLKVTDVSITIQMSMTRKRGRCVNYIEQLTLDDFDKITADMGSGMMSNLKERILEYYAKKSHYSIISLVNRNLEKVSVNAQALTTMCQKIFNRY